MLPKLIKPSPDLYRRLTEGARKILTVMQGKGLVPEAATFEDLLAHPAHLHLSFTRFKENPESGTGIAVNEKGELVRDGNEKLVCGVTLGEVERMIICECADRVFTKAGKDLSGETPKEIRSRIGFIWQLPLLEMYAQEMTADHFRELDKAVYFLKTPETLHMVASMDLADIRHARDVTGDRFMEMMRIEPAAIRGVCKADDKQFQFYSKLTDDRIWKFFGGNQQLVVELLGMPAKRVLAYGPHFPDLCIETLEVLEKVPTPTLTPFMRSFDSVFGSPGRALLGDKQFAQEFLFHVVGDFGKMEANNENEIEAVSEAAAMKWNALKPKLIDWVKANKKTG
ncbi:MAG: hypothetical protein OEY85_04320 [Rhodospirillales bacterium]|nr:hypothetical protein [Rhodospirillales bacterium]